MAMTGASKPAIVQLFENVLWANTPKDCEVKTVYFHSTLFVSIMIPSDNKRGFKKIRRSFTKDRIEERVDDLWGLASDCVDEMLTEPKK